MRDFLEENPEPCGPAAQVLASAAAAKKYARMDASAFRYESFPQSRPLQKRVEDSGFDAGGKHYRPSTGDDIGLFFRVLFPLLPLDRAQPVWSKKARQYQQVKTTDPGTFHRKDSVEWAAALGEHRPLWKWRRVAYEFFRNACPPGQDNAFKWHCFHMSHAEIDLAVT